MYGAVARPQRSRRACTRVGDGDQRMTDQCAELGGHGIVGAALRIKEIPPDTLTAGAIEFTVIGGGAGERLPAAAPPVRL